MKVSCPHFKPFGWLTPKGATYSIASIFTDLVKSFVGDILMPPLSVILPLKKNIEEKFAILRVGDTYNKTVGYNTLKQAQNDGAVVMAYG